MEKGYIMVQLQELLNRIPDYFEPDELAYYSAHCKNEQQIRDKIAWHLHKEITQNPKYGDKYVVRREWAPEGASKSRVDLAILEMDENKNLPPSGVRLMFGLISPQTSICIMR